MKLSEVEMINKEKGLHFFDKDTIKFFNSKIETKGNLIGDKYFITSEKNEDNPRLFSVREFNKETGDTDTIGEFQEFKTRRQAENFAKCMVNKNNVNECRRLDKLERVGI